MIHGSSHATLVASMLHRMTASLVQLQRAPCFQAQNVPGVLQHTDIGLPDADFGQVARQLDSIRLIAAYTRSLAELPLCCCLQAASGDQAQSVQWPRICFSTGAGGRCRRGSSPAEP